MELSQSPDWLNSLADTLFRSTVGAGDPLVSEEALVAAVSGNQVPVRSREASLIVGGMLVDR